MKSPRSERWCETSTRLARTLGVVVGVVSAVAAAARPRAADAPDARPHPLSINTNSTRAPNARAHRRRRRAGAGAPTPTGEDREQKHRRPPSAAPLATSRRRGLASPARLAQFNRRVLKIMAVTRLLVQNVLIYVNSS
jgi:hypothetical protein